MTYSKVVQMGSRAALAGTLFVWALMLTSPSPAVAADADSGNAGWDARVTGTGSVGLQVRRAPSPDAPVEAVLLDGASVHVVEGPHFDAYDQAWYRVTGYNRVGSTGWTAGDYLLGSPPAPQDALAQAAGPGGGGVAGPTFMCQITAYTYQTPGSGAHGSITKSGTVAHWGTVAVDPSVIPLGTRLMIDGFSDVFVAEDTGGAVRGDHVEIFFLDRGSALDFGVQQRRVTVLQAESASTR